MEHLVTMSGHNKNPFLGDYFCWDLLEYAKKAKSYHVPLERADAAQANQPLNLGRMGCLCQLLSPKGNIIGFYTLLFCIPQ
jgi:hypothetical protein